MDNEELNGMAKGKMGPQLLTLWSQKDWCNWEWWN